MLGSKYKSKKNRRMGLTQDNDNRRRIIGYSERFKNSTQFLENNLVKKLIIYTTVNTGTIGW